MDSSKERLLDAASEELWTRGYAATSPNLVQRRAGVGQGSMYHHFRGKADLARAAIERSTLALQRRSDAALSGRTGIEAAIAYLRADRDPLRGCPVGRLVADADVVADPSLRGPVAEALGGIRVRLTALLADDRRCEGRDPAAIAACVVAVIQGGYVLARAADDRTAFDAAVEGAVTLLETLTPGEAN